MAIGAETVDSIAPIAARLICEAEAVGRQISLIGRANQIAVAVEARSVIGAPLPRSGAGLTRRCSRWATT